jgi:hypothetical protein
MYYGEATQNSLLLQTASQIEPLFGTLPLKE